MVIIAKSEGCNVRFVLNRAKMELVSKTERANARKAGAENSVTPETSVEETLLNCRDKMNDRFMRHL